MTSERKPGRKILRRTIVLGLVIVIVGLIAWRVQAALVTAPARMHRGGSALRVDAVRVTRQAVPLTIHAAGSVETFHSVAIRAQVSGVLQKVLFQEGDEVKAGQPLFVIDPKPYQAQVDQARGQLEQDKAKLSADRTNAARMAKLVKQGYVSTQDNLNAQVLVAQDKGLIATDQAKLAQARLSLDYTRISAPIGGKTGALAFKADNLVQANDTTPLVTINQISPIFVQFDIPQSQLDTLLRYRGDPALDIFVRSPDDRLITSGGKLVFIDNTVNKNAGTLSLKAQFANAQHQLWPGELVHVGLQLTVQSGLAVIPSTAVQPGQQGDYVYVVDNGKVAVRNIKVLRQYEDYSVIGEGLDTGDEVVVHIPRALHEGLAVSANLLPPVTIAASGGSANGPASSARTTVAPDAHS